MSDHTHSHDHDHGHEHIHTGSPEETLALLTYLLSHNQHHTQELHELAHQVPEAVSARLHDAVSDYQRGNESFAKALELLKEG